MKKILYILVFLFSLFMLNNRINAYTEYKVGNIIQYNGINYRVISDSGDKDNTVTLLKSEPLTVEEVNLYGGVGTKNNHVNKYAGDSKGEAYNKNGYGALSYYTSEHCGISFDECRSDYASSEIKFVVDS